MLRLSRVMRLDVMPTFSPSELGSGSPSDKRSGNTERMTEQVRWKRCMCRSEETPRSQAVVLREYMGGEEGRPIRCEGNACSLMVAMKEMPNAQQSYNDRQGSR
jgi:hypothetical protein